MKKSANRLIALFVCMALFFTIPVSVFATGNLDPSNIAPEPKVWEYPNFFEKQGDDSAEYKAETYVYLSAMNLKITTQSPDSMIGSGETLTIGISVEGVAPITVLWEVSADDGKTWSTLKSKVVTPEDTSGLLYTIEDAKLNDPELQPYKYRVTVTDGLYTNGADPVKDESHYDSTIIEILVNDHYHNRHISLRDNKDIEVSGFLHDDTRLVVTPIPQSNPTYDAFTNKLNHHEKYAGYIPVILDNVKLVNHDDKVLPFFGEILVDFNVGSAYNGQKLPVYYRDPETGNVEFVEEAEVKNGKISLPFDKMTDFMVAAPVADSCKITATAGKNGSITSPGTTSVRSGSDKTYIFLPEEGYLIDKVYVDGKEVAPQGNSYTFKNISSDHNIEVTFKEAPKSNRTYNVVGISGGHGTIVVPGSGKVTKGSAQVFYFYPDEDYTIDKVTVNGVEYQVIGNSLTISAVLCDTTVKVTYRKAANDEQLPDVTVPITSSAGPHGSISPVGVHQIEYGGDMYYYFIADKGYQVDKVYVDGVEIAYPGRSYHFTNVVTPRDIKVTFKRGTAPDAEVYKVTAIAKKHGRVSPGGVTTVYEGGNLTLYFYPEEGYMVNYVCVNGVNVGRYLDGYTLTDIWEDTEVVVVFMKVIEADTGDDSNMTPWWIALGVAGSASIITGIMALLGKRRKDDEEE